MTTKDRQPTDNASESDATACSTVPHSLRMLLDHRYSQCIRNAFERCESPVEGDLMHCLLKGYHATDIYQQFEVGRYRIDFATADGVGWELDGKKYHDEERDRKRDKWILENSKIRRIIRVEAAAMMYFRDSVLAVIGHFVDHMTQAKEIYGMDSIAARREVDSWFEDNEGQGERSVDCYGEYEMKHSLKHINAYHVSGNVGYVGCPLAFIDDDHEVWGYIERPHQGIAKWLGRVVNRIR